MGTFHQTLASHPEDLVSKPSCHSCIMDQKLGWELSRGSLLPGSPATNWAGRSPTTSRHHTCPPRGKASKGKMSKGKEIGSAIVLRFCH
eukprot:1160272-Pelagomonas_calceolata.AAC.1